MLKHKTLSWQTNKIIVEERKSEKFVIKKFDGIKPTLLFALYNLGCFLNNKHGEKDYYFPSIKERVENEVKARKVLSSLGFKVPKIYWHNERSICMEYLEGENLSQFYKNKKIELVKKISKEIGRQLRQIHDSGFALIDCRTENLYVNKNNEIYYIDLEFFTKASPFRKKCDIVTYDATVLNLEPKRCKAIIEAFHDGYGKNLESDEIVSIILFSLLYPFSLKENLNELAHRSFNLYMLWKKVVIEKKN